jgi:rhodanese-related sulfurtransferase
VFPAHFEGSCGKGMCGRPSTTIGFERRYNPVLQLGRDEFIRLESQVPARPLNMMAILETNRGAADCPWALSIPQADLATRLAEVPKDRDLLVVCARGMRSTRCTAFLRQMGFDRAISMDGGTDGWREAGHRIVAGR